MRVVVTRPEREAQRWVRDLSAQGVEALALPLIQIRPVSIPQDWIRGVQKSDRHIGVMFVSANAADCFFLADPCLVDLFGSTAIDGPRAWVTGPGTAKALLRAGVLPEKIDVPPQGATQFDSEALWQIVHSQIRAGDCVLIVRGTDAVDGLDSGTGTGRDWFARQIAALGAKVEFVVAYQRCVPDFTARERELARAAANDQSVWLFSSAQAVQNLQRAFPELTWSRGRALATHARIAASARDAGFGVVWESRPTLSDVLAALKSGDEL